MTQITHNSFEITLNTLIDKYIPLKKQTNMEIVNNLSRGSLMVN